MDDDARRKSQKRKRASVEEVDDNESGDTAEGERSQGSVTLHDFLQKVSASADGNLCKLELSAHVECGAAFPKDCHEREKADKLAAILRKVTSWRWNVAASRVESSRVGATRKSSKMRVGLSRVLESTREVDRSYPAEHYIYTQWFPNLVQFIKPIGWNSGSPMPDVGGLSLKRGEGPLTPCNS
ncbi:hypothetical protein BC629DRAFT_1443212 [Irpex lacteus]|nr:hypothetical protein BC629DRAFT_1443212 [Irpex lacteus]